MSKEAEASMSEPGKAPAVLWLVLPITFILSAMGIALVDRMGNYTPAIKAHKAE